MLSSLQKALLFCLGLELNAGLSSLSMAYERKRYSLLIPALLMPQSLARRIVSCDHVIGWELVLTGKFMNGLFTFVL